MALAMVGLLSGRTDAQCATADDCGGCGVSWGPGIGPANRPTGCSGPCTNGLGQCGDAGGGGPGGGGGAVDYSLPGLKTVPRRGTSGNANDGNVVFGPMENGFSSDQTTQDFGCTSGVTLGGGIDTREAELMVHAQAVLGNCNTGVSILNACGGHANPFHYHERMTCLHTNDADTG